MSKLVVTASRLSGFRIFRNFVPQKAWQ